MHTNRRSLKIHGEGTKDRVCFMRRWIDLRSYQPYDDAEFIARKERDLKRNLSSRTGLPWWINPGVIAMMKLLCGLGARTVSPVLCLFLRWQSQALAKKATRATATSNTSTGI